ncbi:M20/M25/M40 family metallo-hydrolase [Nitriliruptoraceae bacterium ZYF776]|nr:M20/M25/M40 family metallo-hydrolase [Profundirhabdus halotolerans]
MIRNACVNDGRPDSGEEVRNADLLTSYLEGPGLELTHHEPLPGRRSVLARIEGSDPTAPTVLLLGHTDVVPVSPDEWREDPFGGELIDGEVWGRGAVDMLNLTSSMAVAVKQLATSGFTPRGTLLYLGVADEEAGGTWGAGWLAEHAWDEVGADYVLTESGGIPTDTPGGRRVVLMSGEKGIGWRRLTVHGTPGHGSMPYGADNALVTAAEVVRRLAAYSPAPQLGEHWRAYVAAMGLDPEAEAALLDPGRVRDAIAQMDPRIARYCHAVTHTTFSPNLVHGGTKTNVIPDRVELEVDIRTLPGQDDADVDAMIAEALGPLAARVDVAPAVPSRAATASPTDTPLWDLLERRALATHPGAEVLPWMLVGGTDAAFFRQRGAIAYGAGMFSAKASLAEFQSRFHGHDERIDVDSLGLSAQLWLDVAEGLLS